LSVALNYLFYDKIFLGLHKDKLDPFGVQNYPVVISDNERDMINNNKKTLMFYGDSRAFAWPNLQGDMTNNLNFVNRGVGGQTSIQILQRFPYHVVPYKPDVLVLQLGINDLKLVSLFPQQEKEIIEQCKHNIQQLIKEARALHATVIISTIYPIGSTGQLRRFFGFNETPIIAAVNEVNTFIRTLATENILIFDSYTLLKGEDDKIDKRFSHDWLHLNEQGYQHLNKHLVDILDGETIALKSGK
jgi:lysophospholipase L1-like esterase